LAAKAEASTPSRITYVTSAVHTRTSAKMYPRFLLVLPTSPVLPR
jgi:hypothetical protein